MKGIKECLTWMLDNPMKIIDSENQFWSYRYNDVDDRFELKTKSEQKDKFRLAESFDSLKHSRWQEVVEPVDFLTAYKDCLENGVAYGWYPGGEEEGWYAYLSKIEACPVLYLEESLEKIEFNGSKTWIKEV